MSEETVLAQVQQFLRSAKLPALLEPGEPVLPLTGANLSLEPRPSHVLLEAWEEHRNLSRRIIGANPNGRGRLELTVYKFGRKEGRLSLLDLADPHTAGWRKQGRKLEFRERFRRFLAREFPEWRLALITAEPDLAHSLSPAFPRAFLRRGNRGLAAIAAPPDPDAASGVLAFGLIWLAHLRARHTSTAVEELILLLPAGQETQTALRLRHLKQATRLYLYDEDDETVQLDPRDSGNLDTVLTTCHREPAHPDPLDPSLAAVAGFEPVHRSDGTVSLRIHGLEFGTLPGTHTPAETLSHARELSRLRREPGSLLYAKDPERWLESQARRNLEAIDPSLRTAPAYGQVPAFTGGDRGIADLLAIEHSGRLAVIELKASADLQLPLQALDYWMRVARHAAAGDFAVSGYFPGIAVLPQPPKLLLVAPSLEFHSTAETILSFFSPEIEVCRVGLAADWRRELRAMFRLTGSERP